VTCGADVVACNQLDYFQRKNWTVDCILIRDARKARFESEFKEHYPWLNSLTIADLPSAQFTLREQLFAHERAALVPAVRAALSEPADVFFTNYVFTTPFVAHLPASCRKVLETVDVLTEQFAVAERQLGLPAGPCDHGRKQFLLRTELDLYRLYDAIIMINERECEVVRSHGVPHASYVPQAFVGGQGEPRAPWHEPKYDLIFVGSDAAINVTGVNWFYRNVYVPYLWRYGVRWLVVGGVNRLIDFADAYITRMPEVIGSLSDLYTSAKVAIAPIFDGTGLSIKTVEALAHGCATVLAPVGARGLDDRAAAYVKIDMKAQPRRTAEVILNLLNHPEQRRNLENAALAYVQRCFSQDAYTQAMDRIFSVTLN
jgi:glycosyltransferase involved in cell wall biosynthesis